MSATNLLKYLHLAYFSRHKTDRALFRIIRKLQAGHLVHVGVGSGDLAQQMIELAAKNTRRPRVRYTGIDLFEMRPPETPGLTLKRAHRLFHALPAKTRLVPGDPYSAILRVANSLPDNDLVVISADQDAAALEQAWFFLPRMLHDDSLVLIEDPNHQQAEDGYRVLDVAAVRQLAANSAVERRRAA